MRFFAVGALWYAGLRWGFSFHTQFCFYATSVTCVPCQESQLECAHVLCNGLVSWTMVEEEWQAQKRLKSGGDEVLVQGPHVRRPCRYFHSPPAPRFQPYPNPATIDTCLKLALTGSFLTLGPSAPRSTLNETCLSIESLRMGMLLLP